MAVPCAKENGAWKSYAHCLSLRDTMIDASSGGHCGVRLMGRLLCCLALVIAMSATAAAAEQRLRMVSGLSPPLATDGLRPGFLESVAAEAFRRLGRQIETAALPAERALLNVNAGIDDGELGRIPGIEHDYPNLIRVPEKVFDFDFVGFARDPAVQVDGWQSLRSYSVGHITGWKIYERNTQAARDVTTVRSIRELFGLLEKKRADIVLLERWQGLWELRHRGLRARLLEPPFARSEMFIYLHRKHRDVVPRLAQALADMKADGTYERLRRERLGAGDIE
jgi:polar amino acid transport system substrate-binding protein